LGYSITYSTFDCFPFLSSFLGPFLTAAYLASSSLYFFVTRGAVKIAFSSGVRSSFKVSIYFPLAFFALTALPASLSSHYFLMAFSLSSLVVSLMRATVSEENTVNYQYN